MNAQNRSFPNIEELLNHCVLKKDSKEQVTHTQYSQFRTRTFHVPNELYSHFIQLYHNNIIKSKNTHNLIERQNIHKNGGPGPLLVDIDLQFNSDITERLYSDSHIEQIIEWHLEELSNLFEMDEDNHFQVVVQEKPAPRVITKPNGSSVTKDGIHIMFCVAVDPIYHTYIRDKILNKISDWTLPVTNTWDDVIDKAIATGANGWLCPYSKKKDDSTHYNITKAYNVYYDTDSNHWVKNVLVQSPDQLTAFYAQYHKNLFIRNPDLPKLSLLKESMVEVMEEYANKNKKPTASTTSPSIQGPSTGGDEDWQISVQTIRQIRNKEEADACLNIFLDNLPSHKFDLREAYEYAMALPEPYYGSGSYNRWIKVGFALRNTNVYLLIVWLQVSAKSTTFQWATDVMNVCDFWMKFIHQPEGGVTKQSLMYWCRNENPEGFQKIREQTVDYYLDQSVESLTLDQLNAKGKSRGSCDYDIATLVFHMKKGLFVACGIKNNEWYSFNGSYWQKDDCGTSLRNTLSVEVRGLYMMKSRKFLEKAFTIKTNDGTVDIENEEHILLKARANMMLGIATRLGNTHDKDNIMRESRELFYDKDFETKLDQNRYLLGFKNGVIDFKEKRFRRGIPEDYIAKCTQTDYQELDESRDTLLMEQINKYFHELFPERELYEYMWIHLASMLIGDSAKTQCLHYYIGIGQNGKSMMVKLLEMIMGDYAVPLDAGFFTKERPGRGAATPDIAKLPGVRIAVTSEPTEGGKPVVLYEGPMKQLTSGTDKIAYRALFKDQQYFVPQCHSLIQSNDYIPIRSRDHGTWRRIRVVEFKSLFTDDPIKGDPDKPYQFHKADDFEEKFILWAPVFMSMLVKLAYKMQGAVPICPLVKAASESYRRKQDYISAFIEINLEKTTPNYYLKKSEVTTKFNEWYMSEHGTKLVGKTQEIHAAIDKLFGNYNSSKQGWIGVRVKRNYEVPVSDADDDSNATIDTDSEEGTT
jgi:P4 family phage/plasmid primase-like protien